MYRPRTAILPGLGTTTPVGDISATDWGEAKADIAVAYDEAQLSQTRTFDTRAFPSIQDAIDTAHANGGGTVFLGDSELSPQSLTLYDGVYLTGRGIGATQLKVNSIVGEGSIDPLPGLGVAVTARSRTVTFASPHNLQAGDVFIISDTVASSFSTSRTYYRGGEFCKVAQVDSATQVTLTRPTYEGYATGSAREIYKLVPIRTGVSNMSIEGTSPHVAISVRFGSDLEFSNLALSGTNNAHLSIGRSFSVSISRVKTFDAQAVDQTNYGVIIGNSQRIRISDVELEAASHGLTTGGGDFAANVPNRDIIVSDSYIGSTRSTTGSGRCGCNLHGNTEYVRFNNCTLPTGINPAGDHISIIDCDITTAGWGSAVYMSEMLGANLTIQGCRIRATDDHQSSLGLMYLQFGASAQRGGVLRLIGNQIDLGMNVGDGTLSVMVYILRSNGAAGICQLIIKGNDFHASTTTNRRTVRVRTGTATEWGRIDFIDNSYHPSMTFDFTEQATLPYFEGYGQAVPGFAAQRGSTYARRVDAGADTGLLYVNQSGTTTWTAK